MEGTAASTMAQGLLLLTAALGWWGGRRAYRLQQSGWLPGAIACLAGTAMAQGALGVLLGLAIEQRLFASIRLLAWVTYVHEPLLLLFGAWLVRRAWAGRLILVFGGEPWP